MKIEELPESVKKALKKEEVSDSTKAVKAGHSWLRKRGDILAVIKGIEHDADKIALSFGMFSIEPTFFKGNKTYYIKPTDGRFVPCGHFTLFQLNSMLAQVVDDE